MAELAPTEIVALARILDELDYYQIMHVRPGASAREVKKAYFATSRAFHPDANRHLQGEVRDAVGKIAKRVTEAYSVLRDPRRRAAYDTPFGIAGYPPPTKGALDATPPASATFSAYSSCSCSCGHLLGNSPSP